MAKLLCVCGEVISTSGDIPNPNEWHAHIPNPNEWHALSDVEFDEFAGCVDAEEIYRRTRIFYRCPRSDHIWAFLGRDGQAAAAVLAHANRVEVSARAATAMLAHEAARSRQLRRRALRVGPRASTPPRFAPLARVDSVRVES